MELGNFIITEINIYKKGLFKNKLIANIDENCKSNNRKIKCSMDTINEICGIDEDKPHIKHESNRILIKIKRPFSDIHLYNEIGSIYFSNNDKELSYKSKDGYKIELNYVKKPVLSLNNTGENDKEIDEIKLMMNDEELKKEIELEREKKRKEHEKQRIDSIKKSLDKINSEIKNYMIDFYNDNLNLSYILETYEYEYLKDDLIRLLEKEGFKVKLVELSEEEKERIKRLHICSYTKSYSDYKLVITE